MRKTTYGENNIESPIKEKELSPITSTLSGLGFDLSDIMSDAKLDASEKNVSSCATLFRMMQDGNNLSIKSYTSKDGYPCFMVESSSTASFPIITNDEISGVIISYLIDGTVNEIMSSCKIEYLPEGRDFTCELIRKFIENSKYKIQWTPVFRDRTGYISGVIVFRKGKLFLSTKRTEDLVDYLESNGQHLY